MGLKEQMLNQQKEQEYFKDNPKESSHESPLNTPEEEEQTEETVTDTNLNEESQEIDTNITEPISLSKHSTSYKLFCHLPKICTATFVCLAWSCISFFNFGIAEINEGMYDILKDYTYSTGLIAFGEFIIRSFTMIGCLAGIIGLVGYAFILWGQERFNSLYGGMGDWRTKVLIIFAFALPIMLVWGILGDSEEILYFSTILVIGTAFAPLSLLQDPKAKNTPFYNRVKKYSYLTYGAGAIFFICAMMYVIGNSSSTLLELLIVLILQVAIMYLIGMSKLPANLAKGSYYELFKEITHSLDSCK